MDPQEDQSQRYYVKNNHDEVALVRTCHMKTIMLVQQSYQKHLN